MKPGQEQPQLHDAEEEVRTGMHQAHISKPTERVNKSTVVMQRQEGNFYF